VVSPAGNQTRGGKERLDRLRRDLPALLDKEEKRVFAAAKRAEAAGDRPKAELLFDASRKAFQASQDIQRGVLGQVDLDEALERANQTLMRLSHQV
jgi:hypothetical protein